MTRLTSLGNLFEARAGPAPELPPSAAKAERTLSFEILSFGRGRFSFVFFETSEACLTGALPASPPRDLRQAAQYGRPLNGRSHSGHSGAPHFTQNARDSRSG